VLLSAGEILLHADTGQLIISGTADADVADVWSVDADRVEVRLETTETVYDEVFDRSSISKLVFQGEDGDDRFTNETEIPSAAFGGLGNDALRGGSGRDLLNGQRGHDTLDGRDGDDTLKGHAGRDNLFGSSGKDRLFGGGSRDFLDGGDGDDLLRGQGGSRDTVVGAAGNDEVHGGHGNDVLSGGTGNDSIIGGAGRDQLVETGDVDFRLTDTHLSGLGDDTLEGIEEARLTAGAGDNSLDAAGFTGNLTLSGGAGSDTLVGGAADDSLLGGEGNDFLDGRGGDDTLKGNFGLDLLLGGGGADLLQGKDGDDVIQGGAGDDTLQGGSGNDILQADDGHDLLQGGGDRDLLIGGLGRDELRGGDHDDILIGSTTDFDSDASTLDGFLASWTFPFDYSSRVSSLKDPQAALYLQSGVTVHDDTLVDELYGGSGLDWFFRPGPFGASTLDNLNGVESGEEMNLTLPPEGPSANQVVWPAPPMPQPDYLQTVLDPVFGTQITRITGDAGRRFTAPVNTGGQLTKQWGDTVRNRYVTDSPWNIDGSLIHLRSYDPDHPYQLVLNAASQQPEFLAFLPNTNFRWSQDPSRPTIQYSFVTRVDSSAEDDLIYEYDVTTGTITRTIVLPFNKFYSGKEVIAFVGGRQYVALLGVDKTNPSTGIQAYVVDLDTMEGVESPVVASFPLTDGNTGHVHPESAGLVNTNTLTFSPDGQHILVMYDGPETSENTWRLLDVDLAGGQIAPHVLPDTPGGCPQCSNSDPALGHFPVNWGHPVFAYGANGDIYVVGGSGRWQGEVIDGVQTFGGRAGGVLAFDTRTNAYVSLTNPDDEAKVWHVTATDTDRRGWIFVSYRVDQGGAKYRGEIVALNLDAPGDTEFGMKRLAHTRADSMDSYLGQPHLVASRDGSQLIVSSNWGDSQSPISTYLLEFELPVP